MLTEYLGWSNVVNSRYSGTVLDVSTVTVQHHCNCAVICTCQLVPLKKVTLTSFQTLHKFEENVCLLCEQI